MFIIKNYWRHKHKGTQADTDKNIDNDVKLIFVGIKNIFTSLNVIVYELLIILFIISSIVVVFSRHSGVEPPTNLYHKVA